MPDLDALRARLDALPVDRAPLRRAGLLTLLLVVLLGVTQAITPDMTPASATLGRQDMQPETETRSAPRGGGAWVGGVLLLALGGGALLLMRRRRPAPTAASVLETIETHPLGPNHSLRLVACGGEVLLLDVGAEGARLLRQWPRDRFEGSEPTEAAAAVADGPGALPETDSVAPASPPPLSIATPAPEPEVSEATTPPHPAPARPVAPPQFGAAPAFADVLAQFTTARA